jgi:hypothetical protein
MLRAMFVGLLRLRCCREAVRRCTCLADPGGRCRVQPEASDMIVYGGLSSRWSAQHEGQPWDTS